MNLFVTSLLMTFINILIVAIWRLSGHTGGEICHFKLLNYLYLTIMWWERTQFSNSTFWRLVFSHSWFRIHLQLDFVSLEMNYEPLMWEHQSPKCFGGEPTIQCNSSCGTLRICSYVYPCSKYKVGSYYIILFTQVYNYIHPEEV